jgi:hypothetical protein
MNPLAVGPEWKEIEPLAAQCDAGFKDLAARWAAQHEGADFEAALDNPEARDVFMGAARKLRKAGGHAARILSAVPREPSSRRALNSTLCEALLAYRGLTQAAPSLTGSPS